MNKHGSFLYACAFDKLTNIQVCHLLLGLGMGFTSITSPVLLPKAHLPTSVNQELEAYLSIYCASHPEEWPQALHTLELTHNN